MYARRFLAAAIALPLALTLLTTGCEVDSADTFIRDVPVDFSGFYVGCSNGAPIVQANSGNRIRTLDLRQNGDQLEAFDNNGAIWRGSLGEVQNGRSSFTLEGRTSTGVEGLFSGTLSSSGGGSTTSVSAANGNMTGTYIEPDRFSTFCGNADIPGSIGGGDDGGGSGGGGDVTISLSALSVGINGSVTADASGGTSPYTWTVISGPGTISPVDNDTATYSRGTATGTSATIRATDNDGNTDTAVITFN
jgi:hypothetical protein